MKSKVNFFLYILIALLVTGCKDDNEPKNRGEKEVDVTKTVKMKNESELQTTWDNLEKKIEENPDLWTDIKQVYSQDAKLNIPSTSQVVLRQLYNLIQDPNANPAAASKALEFFVKVNAEEVIRESLLNPRRDIPGWGLVITSSEVVTSKRDEKAAPYLIQVLNRNNYPQEGSEAATVHQHMKRKLIEAMQVVTDLDIDINKINVNDTQQVEHILSLVRDWAKKNNIKLLDE